jgi:hypothetical protein
MKPVVATGRLIQNSQMLLRLPKPMRTTELWASRGVNRHLAQEKK